MVQPKLVVAVRHGNYSMRGGGHLNDDGIADINSISEKIKNLVFGMSVVILTSPATRTVETSNIIADKLGIEVIECCDSLHGDTYSVGVSQMNAIIDLIGENNPEVIIIVTHFEAPSGIIDAFSSSLIDKVVIGNTVIGKGWAIILNLSSGEFEIITP